MSRRRSLTLDKQTLDQIRGAGSILCTHREVAAILSCAYQTWMTFKLENPEAQEAYEDGFEQGKVSLRRKQFKLADKNAAMAIFLGKNILGQTDRQEWSGPGGAPLVSGATVIVATMTAKEAAEAYARAIRT